MSDYLTPHALRREIASLEQNLAERRKGLQAINSRLFWIEEKRSKNHRVKGANKDELKKYEGKRATTSQAILEDELQIENLKGLLAEASQGNVDSGSSEAVLELHSSHPEVPAPLESSVDATVPSAQELPPADTASVQATVDVPTNSNAANIQVSKSTCSSSEAPGKEVANSLASDHTPPTQLNAGHAPPPDPVANANSTNGFISDGIPPYTTPDVDSSNRDNADALLLKSTGEDVQSADAPLSTTGSADAPLPKPARDDAPPKRDADAAFGNNDAGSEGGSDNKLKTKPTETKRATKKSKRDDEPGNDGEGKSSDDLTPAQVNKSIDKFLSDLSLTQLPAKVAQTIRETPDDYTRAATTNRRLALASLTNQNGRTACLHHSLKDRRGLTFDGSDYNDYKFHGTPGQRRYQKADLSELKSGHANCGCTIEDILWDFYWQKTWKGTAEVDGKVIEEGLKDDYLKPRHRWMIIKMFKESCGLTLNQMYQEGKDEKSQKVECLKKQIDFLVNRLNNLVGPSSDGDRQELPGTYKIVPALYNAKAAPSSSKYVEF